MSVDRPVPGNQGAASSGRSWPIRGASEPAAVIDPLLTVST